MVAALKRDVNSATVVLFRVLYSVSRIVFVA